MSARTRWPFALRALLFAAVLGAPSARAGFQAVPLPFAGEELSLVPTHPGLASRGYVGFLHQSSDGSSCEVGWIRVVGSGVVEDHRQPCGERDGFFNLIPAPDGEAAMLAAVTPHGVRRVAPAPAGSLVEADTLVAVPPDLRFAGPELWDDPATPDGALRIVLPELGAVSIWERPAGESAFVERERYPVDVRARFDARLGRDTVHPDYHLLANLRMPKFALGALAADRPRGMVYGLENRIHLVSPTGDGGAPRESEHDLDLFRDDDQGLNVVRGNRLGDFDGDGRLDAVVVAARGGLANLEARAEVYFAPLETSLAAEPAIRYRLTDAAAGTELVDVDGDGARELYRPTVELSIGAVVRILLFKEVRIDYHFAELVSGDPDEPEWFCSIPRTFTVNLSGVANHPGPLFDLRGDLDGDGVTDVVTGTPEDGYDVLWGAKGEGGWCVSDRAERIELPGLETLTVLRLDDDARWDMLAWTRDAAGRTGLTALFSR